MNWHFNDKAYSFSTHNILSVFFFFFKFFVACRILVPWPGMEPLTLALAAQSLNHWTTRKVPMIFFHLIRIWFSIPQWDFQCSSYRSSPSILYLFLNIFRVFVTLVNETFLPISISSWFLLEETKSIDFCIFILQPFHLCHSLYFKYLLLVRFYLLNPIWKPSSLGKSNHSHSHLV